jgi:hypothetical protein
MKIDMEWEALHLARSRGSWSDELRVSTTTVTIRLLASGLYTHLEGGL